MSNEHDMDELSDTMNWNLITDALNVVHNFAVTERNPIECNDISCQNRVKCLLKENNKLQREIEHLKEAQQAVYKLYPRYDNS